jgi:hypothetical protein
VVASPPYDSMLANALQSDVRDLWPIEMKKEPTMEHKINVEPRGTFSPKDFRFSDRTSRSMPTLASFPGVTMYTEEHALPLLARSSPLTDLKSELLKEDANE